MFKEIFLNEYKIIAEGFLLYYHHIIVDSDVKYLCDKIKN